MPEDSIGSDGLVARRVGPWAKDKFYYLERACYIFSRGMRLKWPNRCFIDLFSGPGRGIITRKGHARRAPDEIDGSPLVALSSVEPFTHYYFVDLNADYIEALSHRVQSMYPHANAQYFPQDCNKAIPEILRLLPPASNSLVFAFVDPTGVQIRMDSVAELTRGRRMDLLINYPQNMVVQRLTTLPYTKPHLNAYFGTHEWESVLQHARSKGTHEGDALREFYKMQLQKLGYRSLHFLQDPLIRSDRGTPLYYLLYASKHDRGVDFWKKITKRDHTGQEYFALGE